MTVIETIDHDEYDHRLGKALQIVHREVLRASRKFPPLQSGHEGWAVIKEELDELWEEVKLYPNAPPLMLRNEAMHVAAMAIRFIADVCPEPEEVYTKE